MIDLAVMVRVDPVEALAEAAVAVGLGEPREPIVVGLDLFEPGALAWRQIGGGQLRRELGLAAFDEFDPPLAVLLECDRVVAVGRQGGLRLGRSGGLRGVPRQPEPGGGNYILD
jgi:hypothetical protein